MFCVTVCILVIVVVAIAIGIAMGNASNEADYKNEMIQSEEFQTALKRAREIKKFFQDAVSSQEHGGSVMVLKFNIDKENDWPKELDNPLVYFRVHFEFGKSLYRDYYKSGRDYNGNPLSDEQRIEYMNMYLEEQYGKDKNEIEELGLDPYDIAYDTEPCDGSEYETILYYKFYCPCELKGDERDIFIEQLGRY